MSITNHMEYSQFENLNTRYFSGVDILPTSINPHATLIGFQCDMPVTDDLPHQVTLTQSGNGKDHEYCISYGILTI